MTETTKTIFEKYEIRKTKKQKDAFRNYVKTFSEKNGYQFSVEKGSLGAKNIVIGNVEKANVVFTAHYDTCPRLPFPNFITPKNFLVYLLYQIVISMIFMIAPIVLGIVLWNVLGGALGLSDNLISTLTLPIFYLLLIGIMLLITAGPANHHTANDNTSGITTLLDIMSLLSKEEKEKAAFVFFDLEEMGLFGSTGFAAKHKNTMKNKLLLNFDCVSDGNTILFVLRKGAKTFEPLLRRTFTDTEDIQTEILSKGAFYPSDQVKFPCGVGVAALKKTKRGNILYMDKIHTKNDTVYREENIAYLTKGAIRLLSMM